ncbi:PA domain-containing protein [Ditylenchus destructor]|uniref:PA domain-containing protein n=1 Tax=Ditylenchus destructor TaxID=166010 RepID=A0AAD4N1T3_9BILA|nr:PA domain-containing protein [Ditylenchus destructor]
MNEMNELAREQERQMGLRVDRVVQIVSQPHFGLPQFVASPALFGYDLTDAEPVEAEIATPVPQHGCAMYINAKRVAGRIAMVQRGSCMFQEKARYAQRSGAVGLIITDNNVGSSAAKSPFFAMSADNSRVDDITIPVIFLFHLESQKLQNQLLEYPTMIVSLAEKAYNPGAIFEQYLLTPPWYSRRKVKLANDFLAFNEEKTKVRFNFRFGDITSENDPNERNLIVERNVEAMQRTIIFSSDTYNSKFLNQARVMGYHLLGYPHQMKESDYSELKYLLRHIELLPSSESNAEKVQMSHRLDQTGKTSSVICHLKDAKNYRCVEV